MENHHFDDFDFTMDDDRESVRDLLNMKFKQRCKRMERRGEQYIYKEQSKYASDILSAFKNNIHLSTFVAPVQWGKTGVIISLIHKCCTDETLFINPNNVLVITGMSDNEWKQQTKKRLIKEFRPAVNHLHDILNMNFDEDFRDALIIIDECQIASQDKQSIRKMFLRNNLNNLDYLREKNIRIVQTSATPDNVLVDCMEYDNTEHYTAIVNLDLSDPTRSYKFFTDIDETRLKETMDLTYQPNVDKLFEDILSFNKPRWHIIRIPSTKKDADNETINNLELTAKKKNCDIKYHMMHNKIDDEVDPEQLLSERPKSNKHTIILIKNKWRASKSYPDKYIGVVHERFTQNKPEFATEVQSLAGRMVGHGKLQSKNPPIIYCQLRCIHEYINLFNNNFDYEKTKEWKKSKKPSYMNKMLDA